jgi:RimJ/RimL family protein N-acetyltransferase
MEKCGMRHEGVLRHHIQKNGNFEDVAIYGLHREEYLSGS